MNAHAVALVAVLVVCSAHWAAAAAPDAPAKPVAVTVHQTALVVTWAAPADNGSPINFYEVETNDGAGTEWVSVYSGKELTYTRTGLDVGSEYGFRVKAFNGDGVSDESEPLYVSTDPATVPTFNPPAATTCPDGEMVPMDATTLIRVVETRDHALSLVWSPANGNGADVESYDLYWDNGVESSGDAAAVAEPDSLRVRWSGAAATHVAENLKRDRQYTFRVVAHNAAGVSERSCRFYTTTRTGDDALAEKDTQNENKFHSNGLAALFFPTLGCALVAFYYARKVKKGVATDKDQTVLYVFGALTIFGLAATIAWGIAGF